MNARPIELAAGEKASAPATALLEVANLTVRFASPAGEVHAVEDVSLSIARGELVGIVGELGVGKNRHLHVDDVAPAQSAGTVRERSDYLRRRTSEPLR